MPLIPTFVRLFCTQRGTFECIYWVAWWLYSWAHERSPLCLERRCCLHCGKYAVDFFTVVAVVLSCGLYAVPFFFFLSSFLLPTQFKHVFLSQGSSLLANLPWMLLKLFPLKRLTKPVGKKWFEYFKKVEMDSHTSSSLFIEWWRISVCLRIMTLTCTFCSYWLPLPLPCCCPFVLTSYCYFIN